jgi:hypothetical protein
METFVNSLSQDLSPALKKQTALQQHSQPVVLQYDERTFPLPIDPLTIATQETTVANISADDFVNTGDFTISGFQEMLMKDRAKAEKMIENLLTAADEIKKSHMAHRAITHAHPYYALLHQYLGTDYTIPKIQDLPFPENYDPRKYLKEVEKVSTKLADEFQTQILKMSAEALDMSYPGITGENLGNAFGVLSAAANGSQTYSLDTERLKNHLILAEIFRSTPSEYFINNPMESAKKLIKFYVDINQAYIDCPGFFN